MRLRPLVRRSLLGLVVVLVVAVAALAYVWRGTVPSRGGTQRVPGLAAEVAVVWDSRGVPRVEAGSLEDALRAQGFLHGWLRPFQVEMRRRATYGRLAEVGGPSLVAADEDALRERFQQLAAAEEATLPAAARRAVEVYVEGLNAGLAAATRQPPPALRVARVEPQPWTVRDVLAFGRRFISILSNARGEERSRFDLLRELGPEDGIALWQAAFGEPFPPVPDEMRALLTATRSAPAARLAPAAADGTALAADAAERSVAWPPPPTDDGPLFASNAWAVAPARSATGGALLAGDPHLPYELASLWFEARLHWPGGQMSGASLAGVPGILFGHNARLAWSFTTNNFDDADLFLVAVDDVAAPTRYREGESWRPFEIERHTIPVRGEAPREVVLRRAGPAPYLGPSGLPGYGLLERQASRESGGLLAAIHGLVLAPDVASALRAVDAFPGPAHNLILADAAGTIAHRVVGHYPERRGGAWDGRFPTLWSGLDRWSGFRPGPMLPAAVAPTDGFVVSANDRAFTAAPPGDGQRPVVGDFDADWRARRIRARLEALPAARPEDLQALQLDTQAGSAAELQGLVRRCRIDGAAAQLYLAWDGRMAGSGGPALQTLLRATLAERFRGHTRLGKAGGALFSRTRPLVGLLGRSLDDLWLADWLDDPATTWNETPCQQLRIALDEAWLRLRTAFGDDPTAWEYTRANQLGLRSAVGVGPLARWFNPPPVGVEGAFDAPQVHAARLPRDAWRGEPWSVVHGASYRFVVAFDREGKISSSSALPGGQDEHPASPHAFDRLADYAAGRLAPLEPWSAGHDATRTTLRP